MNSTLYTESIFSSYIDVSIKASTWQPQELSYPHVIKVGGVNQPCVEKTITIRLQNFLILVITTPFRGTKIVLIYFLNIVTLHDVINAQNKGF